MSPIYNERVEIMKLSRLFVNYTTAENARFEQTCEQRTPERNDI